MKQKDIRKLHGLTKAELEQKLADMRRSFVSLRMKKFAGKLDNTAQVAHLAKDIARVLTVMKEKTEVAV